MFKMCATHLPVGNRTELIETVLKGIPGVLARNFKPRLTQASAVVRVPSPKHDMTGGIISPEMSAFSGVSE
jgi:hypothetical protein